MIDWSRVKELQDEVGAEDFGEVVEIFLEEVEGVIEKLETTDRSGLEQDLHFLKGSALNLGFEHFSSLCQEGERMSAQGQAAAVNVPEIIASYQGSKTEFLRDQASHL
ncbi:Hpt domain-containing protein [Phaeobacter italicus]|jgi:HPt (histidine-containing phosphotransfer) domain-containing protein|uniref:TMAO reductase sytem sensor TorS n=1 Tax=Phaeobacter italicus TaxID=481446 RepID=A0A0H5DG26_9RHOB|nr:Hpt domain-containing protein [Phaeobacter italicus]EEB72593.1 Hpt protein [Ruegeria sp. R11]MEE2816390.1 Hpt domain-containing protein [Pseudomonadota bacterium]MBO9443134.1 Hpt domain-containing protein [Phaeobacter italicus]MBY5977605.1 Hpt domain-containing protein [Phaeobacter italicus]MBY6044961.1 Hpt domain-containing protein [Phaeobacter italicus]